jgi:hypothetical protein
MTPSASTSASLRAHADSHLDNVTDGMLRGLGEQIYYMRINILDSFISVILV